MNKSKSKNDKDPVPVEEQRKNQVSPQLLKHNLHACDTPCELCNTVRSLMIASTLLGNDSFANSYVELCRVIDYTAIIEEFAPLPFIELKRALDVASPFLESVAAVWNLEVVIVPHVKHLQALLNSPGWDLL